MLLLIAVAVLAAVAVMHMRRRERKELGAMLEKLDQMTKDWNK